MICRICGSNQVTSVKNISCYLDYQTEIFDCSKCGCRSAQHDSGIYEKLHAVKGGAYRAHETLALKIKKAFDEDDITNLEAILSRVPKYKYVINEARQLGANAKILEVGCSQGYLTAYFIKRKFNIVGVDVSKTAIDRAQKNFGPFFTMPAPLNTSKDALYDMIYHTGTIGCVEDPIGFTTHLISLLKPGGKLIFNSPNKGTADSLNRTWPYGTTPPDLVTIFPEHFWHKQFSKLGKVSIKKEMLNKQEALFQKVAPTILLQGKPFLFKESKFIRLILLTVRKGVQVATSQVTSGESNIVSNYGCYVTIEKK